MVRDHIWVARAITEDHGVIYPGGEQRGREGDQLTWFTWKFPNFSTENPVSQETLESWAN